MPSFPALALGAGEQREHRGAPSPKDGALQAPDLLLRDAALPGMPMHGFVSSDREGEAEGEKEKLKKRRCRELCTPQAAALLQALRPLRAPLLSPSSARLRRTRGWEILLGYSIRVSRE